VVPPLLELDGEPVVGLLDALDADLSRKGWLPDRIARISSAVPAWMRQCGSDRSAKASGVNSPSGAAPVSRNPIR
jgi:hypothetical protein